MVNLYCTGPMDFLMQPLQIQQIKLLINSGTIWDKIGQPIHMYTTYNYTPNRIIMVNLRQHQFSGGRCVPLSWREIGKSIFRLKPTFLAHCIYPRDSFKVLPGVFCARIAEALEEVERHLLSLKIRTWFVGLLCQEILHFAARPTMAW